MTERGLSTESTYDDEALLKVALRVAQLYVDNNRSMLTIRSDEMAEFLRWATEMREERDTAVWLLRLLRDADGPTAEGEAWAEVRSFLGDPEPAESGPTDQGEPN